MKISKLFAAGATTAILFAGAASAATVTLDGGTYVPSANCPSSSTCLKLANEGPKSTATLSAEGDTFTLSSFSYAFSDNKDVFDTGPGALTVSTEGASPSTFTLYGNQDSGPYTYNTALAGVTSVMFANTGKGVVYLEGLPGNVSAVPVPASGLLLLGGLSALALRRRKKAA